jgi:hypothetical protein
LEGNLRAIRFLVLNRKTNSPQKRQAQARASSHPATIQLLPEKAMDANKHLKIARLTAENPGAPKRLSDTCPSGPRFPRPIGPRSFSSFPSVYPISCFSGIPRSKTLQNLGHFNVFTLNPRPFQTFSMAPSKTPAISTKRRQIYSGAFRQPMACPPRRLAYLAGGELNYERAL